MELFDYFSLNNINNIKFDIISYTIVIWIKYSDLFKHNKKALILYDNIEIKKDEIYYCLALKACSNIDTYLKNDAHNCWLKDKLFTKATGSIDNKQYIKK